MRQRGPRGKTLLWCSCTGAPYRARFPCAWWPERL